MRADLRLSGGTSGLLVGVGAGVLAVCEGFWTVAVAVADAVFVGSVSSDFPLVWAPPVLTVTPGAACEVEPVDVEMVDFAPSFPVVDSCSTAVESDVVVVVVVL
ncbi:MAG TPA: hypothetical protein VE666_06625 [Mycobacterium sp.]|nr:hypothetical protein [Mycobacterium sp.]